MSVEFFKPLSHQWDIVRKYVGGQHPVSIRKTCTVCKVDGHKSLMESVAPCPGVPHEAACAKSYGYIRNGSHFECQCGVNRDHEKKLFWKVHVCYFCDRPHDGKFLTKCLKAADGWHRWIWRKR